MVAVTVTDDLAINDPSCEVVYITATDAYTYNSKKFGKIRAATITSNVATGTAAEVTFSGAVATVSWSGVASSVATLTLYGDE